MARILNQEMCIRDRINPREHVSSGNKDIDGILNFMLEKAVSILKKVDVQVKIPEDLHTCSFELAVILGNIIDNAIEARCV